MFRFHVDRDSRVTIIRPSAEPIALDHDDPYAILPWLHVAVEMEPEVTSAILLRALAPWASAIEKMVHVDFDRLRKASTRPMLSNVANLPIDADKRPILPNRDLTGVEISAQIHILNVGADTVMRTQWKTLGTSSLNVDGYVSLARIPFETWARLSIRINPYSVIDGKFAAKARLRPEHTPISRIIQTPPTVFDTLIQGFFASIAFDDRKRSVTGRRSLLNSLNSEIQRPYDDSFA